MKNFLMILLFGWILTNTAFAQLEFNFSSENGPVNGTVDVDVTVNGFQNISVVQFSAAWDSLVMNFDEVIYTNPALGDNLNANNISGPSGALLVPGQFTFSYTNPFGNGNLDDGEVIFTVRFNLVGAECDQTTIEISDQPTAIEAYDKDFNELTVNSTPGTIMIDGTGCGGNGNSDLVVSAPDISIPAGGTVSIPLTVTNFTGVQAGTGTIEWDPAVLDYTGISNINLPSVNGSLNETEVDQGRLRFLWSNPDPSNPFSLADDTPIFNIDFDVVGSIGDMTVIDLVPISSSQSLGFEWTDDNSDVIPTSLVDGKVTIANNGPALTLNISQETVDQNTGTVCVDFSVQNFSNILSMQYVVTWDPNIITNGTPSDLNLPNLTTDNFNPSSDAVSSTIFSWNGSSGVDVADGTVIYKMCFDKVGDCDESTAVEIVSMGTNIEIVDGDTNEITNYQINQGSVTITCMADCSIVNVDRPCPGESGGNVTVNVPTDGCTYSWTDANGNEVATTQNLLGVPAGTYTLSVTCNGAEACMLTAVIEDLPMMTVTESITHIGCGSLGSISVDVQGGSGSYSYDWTPSQSNTPDISGLAAGTYTLTVNDQVTGCSVGPFSYQINEIVDDITINSNITDASCLGNDGSISLQVTGGCPDYTYNWSLSSIGDTPQATGLSGDTYSVTVTDSQGNSATGAFVVDQIEGPTMSNPAQVTPSSGNDGAIIIFIQGGTAPYDYSWSGPTSGLPNSDSVSGLAPGDYTVVVTDAAGCSKTFGPFTVPMLGNELLVSGLMVKGDFNGYNIACNGGQTSITGSIDGGSLPIEVLVTGDDTKSFTINSIGTFELEGFNAGQYALTFTDALGATASFDDISVTQPDPFFLNLGSNDTGCDNGNGDGFIDLVVSGGVGDLTYEWNDPALSGASVDNLSVGNYVVLITDENGCEIMETIQIKDCNGPEIPCYEVRDIITPNGDGKNDRFMITCLDDFPASLEVYDRWGKLVFKQQNYLGDWDGVASDGTTLPEGGYMYVLTIDFGQGRRELMKGTLTILRN